jgi:hypothetical protein
MLFVMAWNDCIVSEVPSLFDMVLCDFRGCPEVTHIFKELLIEARLSVIRSQRDARRMFLGARFSLGHNHG